MAKKTPRPQTDPQTQPQTESDKRDEARAALAAAIAELQAADGELSREASARCEADWERCTRRVRAAREALGRGSRFYN